MRFNEKSIIVNGRKVFYLEKDCGEKTLAVFLHGFPGSHKGIMEMADFIKGFNIIVPDLPACGKSETLIEKHFLKNYSNWLNNFLDAISANEKVVIIGHSFGARLAVTFAENYPERLKKLVLIAPVVKSDSLIGKITSLDYKLAELLPAGIQKAWIFNKLFRVIKHKLVHKSPSPSRRKQMIKFEGEDIKDADTKAIREVFEEFSRQKPISFGKPINAKAFVIACDKDEIATLNSVKELYNNRLSGADMEIMKNCGHLVVPEKPKAVGNIINKWLMKL